MAKLQLGWRRVLAAAICVIVAAVCVYFAWTADPGATIWLNDGDGSGRGHIITISTAKNVEQLRKMVYPEDPTKGRYPGLEPMLRSQERKLATIHTKQTVYVAVAAVMVLAAGAIIVFGRRRRANAEASRTPSQPDVEKKPMSTRFWLAIGLVVGFAMIVIVVLLWSTGSEVRVVTTFGEAH